MPNLWMVRSQRGLLFDKFIENGVVLLGWHEVGDLSDFGSRDEVFMKLTSVFPDRLEQANRVHAGVLFRFANEFSADDEVLTYHPGRRKYHFGKIEGSYSYDSSIDQEYPNMWKVKWLKEIDRDALSQRTKNQLGSTISLFRLSDDAVAEIDALVAGSPEYEKPKGDDEGFEEESLRDNLDEQSIELIKDKINLLGWEEMQDLVSGLMRSLGYKTKVSPPGPYGGIDVVASPDGFGFTPPRILVQVKHRQNKTMDIDDIKSFVTTVGEDEGLYVSTGGFAKNAKVEARSQKLELMDIDDFARAIIDQYEKCDMETKQLLPLKRLYWPA